MSRSRKPVPSRAVVAEPVVEAPVDVHEPIRATDEETFPVAAPPLPEPVAAPRAAPVTLTIELAVRTEATSPLGQQVAAAHTLTDLADLFQALSRTGLRGTLDIRHR